MRTSLIELNNDEADIITAYRSCVHRIEHGVSSVTIEMERMRQIAGLKLTSVKSEPQDKMRASLN